MTSEEGEQWRRTADERARQIAELEAAVERLKSGQWKLMGELAKTTGERDRLKVDRDRFQAIVHAVSPYLDPACLGLTPEMASERLKAREEEPRYCEHCDMGNEHVRCSCLDQPWNGRERE